MIALNVKESVQIQHENSRNYFKFNPLMPGGNKRSYVLKQTSRQ